MSVLILFRSLTYAQRGSRILERAGIPATVVKAPQGTTEHGCTYAVRLAESRLKAALKALEESRLQRGRILYAEPGGYREAAL